MADIEDTLADMFRQHREELGEDRFQALWLGLHREPPRQPWVVIDARDQVLRCNGCGCTHPLADGITHKPIWFATAIMEAFGREHRECKK